MIVRQQSLGVQVAESLRIEIFSGALPEGTPLTEPWLSREFEVSRGPVRDAIAKLEADGLIQQDGRSYKVSDRINEVVKELYELRFLLERRAIEIALERDADWSATTEALDAFARAANSNDVDSARDADFRFHQSFLSASEGRLALSMWEICERNFKALLLVNRAQDDDIQNEVKIHEELLNSVADGSGWEEKLREHFEIASHRFSNREKAL